MASNIEFQTIDETFPRAGEDNNSQGFRDNFNIIRTSLGDAKSEITDLQDTSARKDEDNDFANNSLIRVNLDTMTLTYLAGGTITTGIAEVSIENGHYQTFSLSAETRFSLADWPNENFASVVVEVVSSDTNTYIAEFDSPEQGGVFMSGGTGFLPAGQQTVPGVNGGNPISGSSASILKVVVDSDTTPKVIEFWSYDNGNNIYARSLGSYNNNVSATTEINGSVTITGDLTLDGAFTGPGLTVAGLNEVGDVDVATPANGDFIRFNNSNSTWEAQQITSLTATITGDIIASGGATLVDHVNETFTGSLTGDVTGNVTGDLTGDVLLDGGGTVINSATGLVTPDTLVLPSLTTTQRDGLSPTVGTVIFNTTASTFQGWNGSSWVNLS